MRGNGLIDYLATPQAITRRLSHLRATGAEVSFAFIVKVGFQEIQVIGLHNFVVCIRSTSSGLLWPLNKVGKLGGLFDESSDKCTTGDNLPILFPGLVQRGADQCSGKPPPAKFLRDICVIENDLLTVLDVRKERALSACLHLELLQMKVVQNRG